MLTKLLAATIAGGIAFFILGFLIFGLVLGPNVMLPNVNPDAAKILNETPVWAPLIFSNLAIALLLAYIFETLAGIRSFAGGLKAGAIILFVLDLYIQLSFLAFMKMHTSLTPVIADLIGTTVMGAIAGGVIGAVLGAMNKGPATADA